MQGKQCIVVFDDQHSLCYPYGYDPDCDGALCASSDAPTVVFPDRAAARTAIRISKKFAELNLAQGKPVNSDFTEHIRNVRIFPVVFATQDTEH